MKNKVLSPKLRCFVAMAIGRNETDEIINDIRKIATEAYRKLHAKNPKAERNDVKRFIKQTIDTYTHKQLARSPLVIPVVVES